MATSLQQYARATISVGAIDILQATSVTVKTTSGSQPVHTFLGYVGETPGSSMVEMTVEAQVAQDLIGSEGGSPTMIDPIKYLNVLNIGTVAGASDPDGAFGTEFTLRVGDLGKVFQFKGFIVEHNFNYAINANSKITFSARGKLVTAYEG